MIIVYFVYIVGGEDFYGGLLVWLLEVVGFYVVYYFLVDQFMQYISGIVCGGLVLEVYMQNFDVLCLCLLLDECELGWLLIVIIGVLVVFVLEDKYYGLFDFGQCFMSGLFGDVGIQLMVCQQLVEVFCGVFMFFDEFGLQMQQWQEYYQWFKILIWCECEVLECLVKGWLNKQIVVELGILEWIVKVYCQQVMCKMNVGLLVVLVVVMMCY